MSVSALRHVGIVVSDMNASLPFYRDLLGMEPWYDRTNAGPYIDAVTGVKGAKLRMIKLRAPTGGSIELLQYLSHPAGVAPARRACDVGVNHVALQVADLAALYRGLRARGIRFESEPQASPDGYAKVVYCRDPENVIVELVEVLEKR
jgi:catechol 2,3-dioxygenase-like lactoylglutathione lyase family enzyme